MLYFFLRVYIGEFLFVLGMIYALSFDIQNLSNTSVKIMSKHINLNSYEGTWKSSVMH